jgi:ribosomal protein S18 acetylase RimI-like enzyme
VPDESALDNPAYAALSTVHSRFALRSGRALRYPADMVRFLALPSEASLADWRDAGRLVTEATAVAVLRVGSEPPDDWTTLQAFDVVQMTGDDVGGVDEPEAVPLGPADVPEMLELVDATQPGPFGERTIELGDYIGIRRDGELVAMAGERLHLTGWTEISAVCTAPGHRGRGMASRLISAVVAGIHGRAERAFLHVLPTNTGAIRLYEGLGFHTRRALTITVVTPGQ